MSNLPSSRPAFAYDVAVNVVGNLVAASIIYAVGAAVGLFPQLRTAQAIAYAVIIGTGALSLLSGAREWSWHLRAHGIFALATGLLMMLSFLYGEWHWWYVPIGLVVSLGGVGLLKTRSSETPSDGHAEAE